MEHWITAGGTRLFVEEQGAGPAILLAHGMWCNGRMFHELAAALGEGHRLITPDLRGHGRSERPEAAWGMSDLADDLVAILDALAEPRVVLVGFSMGGMAALDFAVRYPGRLAGLALLSTTAFAETPIRRSGIEILMRWLRLVGARDFALREASRWMFSGEFRRRHPETVRAWHRDLVAMRTDRLVDALVAVGRRPSLADKLPALTVPVAIADGDRDGLVSRREVTRMARLLPQAGVTMLPGAGHAIPVERPRDVARIILGLAEEAEKGKPGRRTGRRSGAHERTP